NDEVSVHCDSAEPYDLPSSGPDGADGPQVEGPVMEEWNGPGPAVSPKAQPAAAPAPQPAVTNGNGSSYAGGNTDGNRRSVSEDGHSYATVDPGRRKLLINLTETDQPEEDTYLLRSVLQTLLDYPGNDEVDLLIASQGKRWRLEMPIIRTSYCDELAGRVAELLGRDDALMFAGTPQTAAV
ncbi:MAG: hypothetical protein WD645_03210, partial [Dehalococcoidia bacterium]